MKIPFCCTRGDGYCSWCSEQGFSAYAHLPLAMGEETNAAQLHPRPGRQPVSRSHWRAANIWRGRLTASPAIPFPARNDSPGGVAFKTPFWHDLFEQYHGGTSETGIGTWSDDDFVRALHAGVAKNGEPLYPALPVRLVHCQVKPRRHLGHQSSTCSSLPVAHALAKPNRNVLPFQPTLGFELLERFWFLRIRSLSRDGRENQTRGIEAPISLPRSATAMNVIPPRNVLFGLSHDRELTGEVLQ